jgi:hypothetical protein
MRTVGKRSGVKDETQGEAQSEVFEDAEAGQHASRYYRVVAM